MFNCSICLEQKTQVEGTYLHDDHQLCITCLQGLVLNKYNTVEKLPLKWEKATRKVQVDQEEIELTCPLCRKNCYPTMTDVIIEKLDKFDNQYMLAMLVIKQVATQHLIEKKLNDDMKHLATLQQQQKLIAEYKIILQKKYSISDNEMHCPHSIKGLLDLQGKVLLKLPQTDQPSHTEQFWIDIIELCQECKEVLVKRLIDMDNQNDEDPIRKQVKI